MQTILLQAASPGGAAGYSQLLLFGAMAVILYLFFFRPQQQKQKKQKEFINNLEKGKSVVTLGGIHGKIAGLNENTIVLEVDKGTKLTVERSSISQELSTIDDQKDKDKK